MSSEKCNFDDWDSNHFFPGCMGTAAALGCGKEKEDVMVFCTCDNRPSQSNCDPMSELRIVRAAIRDKFGGIHSVPIPGRHHDVIKQMRDAGYTDSVSGLDKQGFLLSDGKFVLRKPALRVAKKAGQLKGGKTIASILTSEDLW